MSRAAVPESPVEAARAIDTSAAIDGGHKVSDFRALLLAGTPLIDVRAPVEFAKGAFPGAVNLPLMTDEERHLIGVRYKQAGQDKAIELGAELVDEAKRIARTHAWRTFVEAHPDAVLYCFRGGLRSRITQAWLREAGIDRPLVEGGYKALRQYVLATIERLSTSMTFRLVGGRTGSGKTLLIRRLARALDLEDLALHRGSSFGRLAAPQPTNIDFENALAIDLLRLEEENGAAVVYLEDEAKLIGRVCLPPVFHAAMLRSNAIVLETPLAERVRICFEDYVPNLLAQYRVELGDEAGFEAFAAYHRASLDRIRKRLGGERHVEASRLLDKAIAAHRTEGDTGGYGAFIELLLVRYYDPMYDYQLASKQRRIEFRGSAEEILAWIGEREVS